MDKKLLEDTLNHINEKHMKIFEEYVSSGFLQSVARILCYLPKETSTKRMEEYPAQYRDKLKALVKEYEDDVYSNSHQALQVLEMFDKDCSKDLNKAVEIMNHFTMSECEEVIDKTLSSNPVLVSALKGQGFRIIDLVNLKDREIQSLLREVSMEELAVVLKRQDKDVIKKITSNMSKRTADDFTARIEMMDEAGNDRYSYCEEKIIRTVLMLEEYGVINTGN